MQRAARLTGTPSSAATFSFTVTATDSVGATGSRTYSVTINPGITIAPASLPATTVGVAYSQSITAIGGNGTYTFSVSAGALPAGLALNASTGALTGTPTASGTFNFTAHGDRWSRGDGVSRVFAADQRSDRGQPGELAGWLSGRCIQPDAVDDRRNRGEDVRRHSRHSSQRA